MCMLLVALILHLSFLFQVGFAKGVITTSIDVTISTPLYKGYLPDLAGLALPET